MTNGRLNSRRVHAISENVSLSWGVDSQDHSAQGCLEDCLPRPEPRSWSAPGGERPLAIGGWARSNSEKSGAGTAKAWACGPSRWHRRRFQDRRRWHAPRPSADPGVEQECVVFPAPARRSTSTCWPAAPRPA